MTYSPVNSMVNKAFQIRGTNNFVSSGVRRKLESCEWDEMLCFTHIWSHYLYKKPARTKKMMARAPGRPFRAVSVIRGRTHGRGKKRLSWMLILTLN